MPAKLLFRLAWRNIWRHRRRNAILLSAIGVAVAGVVLLNTLLRGMQHDMRDAVIDNLTGHIKVLMPGYLDDPSIERGFAPATSGTSTSGRTRSPAGRRACGCRRSS